ncbi:MAG: hypothetical protein ACXVB1_16945 [Pseudobdellovibrionaceae bacterium]
MTERTDNLRIQMAKFLLFLLAILKVLFVGMGGNALGLQIWLT